MICAGDVKKASLPVSAVQKTWTDATGAFCFAVEIKTQNGKKPLDFAGRTAIMSGYAELECYFLCKKGLYPFAQSALL